MNVETVASTSELKEIAESPQLTLEAPTRLIGPTFAEVRKTGEHFNVSLTRSLPEQQSTPWGEEFLSNIKKDFERYPNNTKTLLNYSMALMVTKQFGEAYELLERILKMDPEHYLARIQKAKLLSATERLEDASGIYRAILEDYPDDPVANLGEAQIDLRNGRPDMALERINAASDRTTSAMLHFYRGLVQLSSSQTKSAVHSLRMAVRDNLASPQMHHALAVAYLLNGQVDDAIRSLKVVLNLDARASSSVFVLADILLKQKRPDEALRLLRACAAVNSDVNNNEIYGRTLYLTGEFEEALRALLPVFESLRNNPDVDGNRKGAIANDIGACYARLRQQENADDYFMLAHEINRTPQHEPLFNRGILKLTKEQWEDAKELFKAALGIAPGDQASRVGLSVAYERVGKFEEALGLLRIVLAGTNPPAVAFAQLGWLLSDFSDDYYEAIAVLVMGVKRYPNSAAIINNLAYALIRAGRLEEARDQLKSLHYDKITQMERVYLTATQGLLALYSGNTQEASATYRQATRMAERAGERELAKRVKQRFALEMVSHYLRTGELALAAQEMKSVKQLGDMSGIYAYEQRRIETRLDAMRELE